jgi:hypothetical protein
MAPTVIKTDREITLRVYEPKQDSNTGSHYTGYRLHSFFHQLKYSICRLQDGY